MVVDSREDLLRRLIRLIGDDRKPFIETGRKFDRIMVDGDTRFFVARTSVLGTMFVGDIFGAKSKVAPNLRWYFGNIVNADKWNWSGFHPVPENDPSVKTMKSYGSYTHWKKVSA